MYIIKSSLTDPKMYVSSDAQYIYVICCLNFFMLKLFVVVYVYVCTNVGIS